MENQAINQFPKIHILVTSAERNGNIMDIENATPQELFSILNLIQSEWMVTITKMDL